MRRNAFSRARLMDELRDFAAGYSVADLKKYAALDWSDIQVKYYGVVTPFIAAVRRADGNMMPGMFPAYWYQFQNLVKQITGPNPRRNAEIGPTYRPSRRTMRSLEGVGREHRIKIAKKTLRMPDAAVGIMGGPDKAESRDILLRAGWTAQRVANWENYRGPGPTAINPSRLKFRHGVPPWRRGATPAPRVPRTDPAGAWNETRSMPELYADVSRIEMRKGGKSAFPGEKFYHEFKGGAVKALGIPMGAEIHINGMVYAVKTRCIMLRGKNDLWFYQKVK